MRKIYFLFCIALFLYISVTSAQNFDVPILVTDGCGSITLTLGVDPSGTDGFDSGLDVYAPPPPPTGAFDARFCILSEDYIKDIRDSLSSEKQFHMSYQISTGCGPIVLHWDMTHVDSLGTFFIVDDITGALLAPIDMSTIDSLVVTDPLIFEKLRILVTPYTINIHPPELDSIPNQYMNEGEVLNVPLNSTDSDEDNITLSSPNLPAFCNLTDNGDGTGMISFTPQVGDAATYPDIMVIATDDGHPSPKADTVSFTLTVGIEAILDPGNLTATSSVENEVELNWTDNSDNEDGFIIEREIPGTEAYTVIDSVSSNIIMYTDETVLDGVKYSYKIKAYNAFTESGYTNSTQAVTILPAPTNLTSQVLESPWSVKLIWEDNSDNESGFCITRDSANTGFVNYDSVNANVITYNDVFVTFMKSYIYKVYAFTPDTISDYSDTSGAIITDVETNEDLTPKDYMLYQNYPNPFNPATKIKYALPEQSKVKLIIYNTIGEMVDILVNEIQSDGYYEVAFNASNLPSGIYLYRLTANENIQVKKMILIK